MKIVKIRGYGHMGFHAYTTLYLANCAILNIAPDEIPVMDISNFESTYHDDQSENIWTKYFDQVEYNEEDIVRENEKGMFYNANGFMAPSERHLFSRMLHSYLKIKPHILEKVDNFKKQHFEGNKVLGVHIRISDLHDRPTLPFEFYKHKIDLYLEKEHYNKIFVSADQQDTMEALKEIYDDKIIEYPVLRYTSQGCNYPINHPEVHQRPNPGYMRGEEVLVESLLLAHTNFMFKTLSNVTNFTLMYNPNLEYCNIDFHFLENGDYPYQTTEETFRYNCKYETKEDIQHFINKTKKHA
jgi:hypothetical protein